MFCCLVIDAANDRLRSSNALEAVARASSPHVECHGGDAVLFDASGLSRVLGPPSEVAHAVRRLAIEQHQLAVRVAMADTKVAAWLLAHARPGITVVPAGEGAAAIAGLPLASLLSLPDRSPAAASSPKPQASSLRPHTDLLAVLTRWGLRTVGDLARLPGAGVRARLGDCGARWHQAARAEDAEPLVPVSEPVRFVERTELEWPIDGLEPLSFVLARLCEMLSASLERADRGAVTIATRLRLVTRDLHERVLHVPAPMREARVLRTLILLDLESHPPHAAVDVVEVELDVTPGRICQGSLLTHALPSMEDIATLVARLRALAGESRVGAPALVDTHDDRAVAMTDFAPAARSRRDRNAVQPVGPGVSASVCLRRYRLPIAARVDVDRGAPARVMPAAAGLAGGPVVARAGPWRTSGRWWSLDRTAWDRDEWDVELSGGAVYRLARDRATGRWEIEGNLD